MGPREDGDSRDGALTSFEKAPVGSNGSPTPGSVIGRAFALSFTLSALLLFAASFLALKAARVSYENDEGLWDMLWDGDWVEEWWPTSATPGSSLLRARRLMAKHPVIDGHNDWPMKIRWLYKSRLEGLDLENLNKTEFNTDLNRLKFGRVGGVFWSTYVPCQKNFSSYNDNLRLVTEQIDLVKRLAHKYPLRLQYVETAADFRAARKAGRVASLIGMEGGHSIDNSLAVLRVLHAAGARYMTLTHTCHTAWADSQYPPPLHNGLTDFGRTVVREMNRLGMLVDLAHVSHQTMRDALDVSQAPAFFSHSSAFALCNTTRNVPDDVLLRVRDTDGVIMVNFYPRIVKCAEPHNATISDVADHITYIRDLIGARHIGIGADFDGIETVPIGMEWGVAHYPRLIAELIQRGFKSSELKSILGRNLIRVLAKTERIAEKLKGTPPAEDWLVVNKTCPDRPPRGPWALGDHSNEL